MSPSLWVLLIQTLFFLLWCIWEVFLIEASCLHGFVLLVVVFVCSVHKRDLFIGDAEILAMLHQRETRSQVTHTHKNLKKQKKHWNIQINNKKALCLLYLHSNLPHLFSKRTANIYNLTYNLLFPLFRQWPAGHTNFWSICLFHRSFFSEIHHVCSFPSMAYVVAALVLLTKQPTILGTCPRCIIRLAAFLNRVTT